MKNKQQSEGGALCEIARKIRLVVFDFDGVFTNNLVLVLQDGTEGVLCNRSDGLGLQALRDRGVELLVLSTEVNPVVTVRCRKLEIPCFQGCEDKAVVLEEQAAGLHIALEETAFLGNDVNDLGCLKKVGLPACVADSHPAVPASCKYVTKRPGGGGAVRELCDLIAEAKDAELR
jgi:3-deoxy-D-manno-octulosonate 8-phosphate phosphatase (KDO 8-P phosphatase)